VGQALGDGLLDSGWAVVAADDGAAVLLVERAGLVPIANPSPEAGISHSIRLGLDAAAAQQTLDALLLLLGDQPLVEVETMRRLIEAWRKGGGPVVRPRYRDQPDIPGHPVLLDRRVWPTCRRAVGDSGLAGLLPDADIIDVPGDNPDIDTPADLHLLQEHG
jgi:molybdenum cofactor cytidylyltransferase